MPDPTPETVDESKISPGTFPFPITEGARESEYLTWVRNRANYMAVGGLLDYVRAVGILLRGMLVNFLIVLPNLLFLSVFVAVAKFYEMPPPYFITKALLILFGLSIFLFPISIPFFRIIRYNKIKKTGSETTVQLRNKYERSFGGFILLIIAVAIVESLPGLLALYQREVSWPSLASAAALVTAIFTIAPNVISALGEGLTKKLAIIGFGLLGLIIPLFVVMSAAGFIVYSAPVDLTFWLLVVGVFFPVLAIIAILIGLAFRVFGKGDSRGLVLVLLLCAGLVVVSNWVDVKVVDTFFVQDEQGNYEPMLYQDSVLAALDQSDFEQTAVSNLAVSEERNIAEMFGLFDEYWAEVDSLGYLDSLEVNRDEFIIPEFADMAIYAGFLPEYAFLDSLITDPLLACDEDGSSDDCARLYDDLDLLEVSATFLGNAYNQESPKELADYLIGIPQVVIDTFLNARASFPYLQEIAGVSWDSTQAGGAARYSCMIQDSTGVSDKGPCYYIDLDSEDLISNDSLPPVCEMQCVFTDFGEWFGDTREEIAQMVIDSAYVAIDSTGLLIESEADEEIYASYGVMRSFEARFWPKVIFVFLCGLQMWFFCWLTVDVNLTSINGVYRDRLASTFLVGKNEDEYIDIERDINLSQMCNYDAGSIAPYHIINSAINLQGSSDMEIRDRNSDFFIFTRKFIGGPRTDYCRSENLEKVFPSMNLATAMAISAAAASPNMGRTTSPGLRLIMTLLNVRLGFWLPNPGVLHKWLAENYASQHPVDRYTETHVFHEELLELEKRWTQLGANEDRKLARVEGHDVLIPSLQHNLAGIGFSGGGIRSATFNLGLVQALERGGVFQHMDYMSTVSGGGYLGSSISALMRHPDPPNEELNKTVVTMGQIFRWRVRPSALLREALGNLNENSDWVNVSDGGHIENLGAIELLRRKCTFILIGDGQADLNNSFASLAILIQTARIDLGIEININVDPLRMDEDGNCQSHWAIGRISYPGEAEDGYLLYIKSSLTGDDEDEAIRSYRTLNPTFPHESIADQFFSEGQFEAYRSLGQHVGEQVLQGGGLPVKRGEPMPFETFKRWIHTLNEPDQT